MAEVDVGGLCLAYQQHGNGPDLVLVHGLATNRAFWFLPYALPLARHFRVTIYDLRGHGYSSMPTTGYDAATAAGDLLALLDHLGIERCHLVGHSYGGGIALEFAGLHPARVERLVVLDTKVNTLQPEQRLTDSPVLSPYEIEVAERDGRDWTQEPQVGLAFLEVLARWKLAGDGSTARDSFTPFGEGRGALRTAKRFVELLDTTAVREEILRPGIDAAGIRALPMPALWVYGEWSRCLPSYRALQALRPASEFRLVPQAGHFFPIGNAGMVMGWLQEFLGLAQPA